MMAARKVGARPHKKSATRPGKGGAKTNLLATYRAKRDFSRTPEPSGATVTPGHRLIIQHHFATRDHYDLRLETEGVLKSWAVTRGPSADPHDRRLAVRTEDHPLDYATFEGLIPKEQYGGGTVILWEYTTFTPLNGDAGDAIDKGEIKFLAHGARMRGRWVLVRMKPRPGEKRENWLLIKERDEFAEGDDSLTARFPNSVSTERSREEIEKGKPALGRTPLPLEGRERAPALPAFVAPQLCTQVETPPAGDDWLYELKYDGYRLQLAVADGKARLHTRTGLDWTRKFGAVAADAARLKCKSALIDGEAIVMNAKGVSDFPGLVAALEQHRSGDIALMAFDLLFLDGADMREKPLHQRKRKLAALLETAPHNIRFAAHMESEGKATFDAAIAAGAEGVIAKRRDAPYRSGRTHSWLKIKGYPRADVLIVGYKPSTRHELFASLHAALEEGDELRYIGGIGTGFSEQTRKAIYAKLTADAGPQPAGLHGEIPRGLEFLRTPLRAEIRFGGWTGSGQLRQARFLALREDLPVPKTTEPAAPRVARRAAAPEPKADEKPVLITHPDRVVYPDDGVTKGEIADYYAAVADRILRHLRDRPVSIVRAPVNIAETFFQRHPLKGMTRGIIEIPQAGDEAYMALDGALGLRTAAQFGAIELHGWMSRLDRIDYPDRLVFDLDPDEAVPFSAVRNAARKIAGHLADVGLKSWPMISGGKGVHVVAPLDRSLPFSETEIFAQGFAAGLAEQAPQEFVATMSKARRKGKIFVDWLRNKRSATAILPWSLRARKGATVAVPLSWDALSRVKSPAAYDIRSARKRPDPWDEFFETEQTIPKAALDFMKRRR